MTADPCRGCYDCCRDLAIYADREDAAFEPRIAAEAQWDEKRKVYRLVPRFMGKTMHLRCPFLKGWGCSIYETRPAVCRAFRPGSQACTEARGRHGKGAIE